MTNFSVLLLIVLALALVSTVTACLRWKLARDREERYRQVFLSLLKMQEDQQDHWTVK